jgi:ABC-type dipeptide/oligopeptide/nickel transport system ATPase component
MFEGRIVEHGPVGRIFTDPRHPHTRALIAAVPTLPAAAGPAAP